MSAVDDERDAPPSEVPSERSTRTIPKRIVENRSLNALLR
jgi:hypothetical protein